MPALLPREELLRKEAALRAADELGREEAQRLALEELAKVAGQLLASGIEKQAIRTMSRGYAAQKGISFNRDLYKNVVGKAVPAVKKRLPSPAPAGKALLGLMGTGLLAYGATKAVPWAMRQMEHASVSPAAPLAGWSPIDYGYGPNPWGAAEGGLTGRGA